MKQSLIYNNRQCFVLIFNDITNVKRLALMEYQNLKMQLRQSSVTHELITPLRCISSFSEELVSSLKDSSNKRIAELINNTSKLVHA